MGIFLRHSYNIPLPRWGSFADNQYALFKNCEDIYGIDPNSIRCAMPLMWERDNIRIFDYSHYKNDGISDLHGDHVEAIWKNGYRYFNGTDQVIGLDTNSIPISNFTYHFILNPLSTGVRVILGAQGSSIEYRIENDSRIGLIKSGVVNIGVSTDTVIFNKDQQVAVTYDSSGNWAHYIRGKQSGTGTNLQTFNYPTYLLLGRSQYFFYYHGGIRHFELFASVLTEKQISLLNDIPYGLYQKVSRPFYLLPTAPPVGWTGEIIGVTNPTEILGIATSGISEVAGI